MMNHDVTVSLESPDGLSKEQWLFSLWNETFYLDWYAFYRRASKRHKFQVEAEYRRLNDRRNLSLPFDKVPLYGTITTSALEQFKSRLKVSREEWKRF